MKLLTMFEIVDDDFDNGTQWINLVGEHTYELGEVKQLDIDSEDQVVEKVLTLLFKKLEELND